MGVEDIIINPNYTGRVEDGYDIALLQLPTPSLHSLPRLARSTAQLHPMTDGLVALGWGKTENGDFPEMLRMASTITILDNDVCNVDGLWDGIITDSMICAKSFPGENVCEGEWL